MKAIIVFYDSLNRRYLPTYNHDCGTVAPNFSRLEQHAVSFDNSYVGSMPCIPARRELHTGRYNFLHREWGPLEPFDDSMPEILKNAGIYTHLISDHLHYWEDGGATYHTRYNSWECIRGQEGDHWKGQLSDPVIPDVVRIPQAQQGKGTTSGWRYDWINREYIRDEDSFPQSQTFQKGCEFIEKNAKSDNWMLQIETFDPHEPFYVPEKYLEDYPEHYDGKHFDWPRGKVSETDQEIAHCQRQYKALVTMCDKNLGRVLDLMDKYDLWSDTMLIVGTDHGFLLSEHGFWGKNQMPYFNEIANTPLYIWDPRTKKSGEHRNSIVQLIDWAPTLLSYFGRDIPKSMQGKDLQDTICFDKQVRDTALYGTFSGHVNITDAHYTYMRASVPEHKDDVYNYTLMPTHMTKRFTPEELKDLELVEPFSFTKNVRVLRVKSHDKYNVSRFGNLLFDIHKDPGQTKPVDDLSNETRLIDNMVELMKENDSPKEQYIRLGLQDVAEKHGIKMKGTL